MLIKQMFSYCGFRLRELDNIPGKAATTAKALKVRIMFMPDRVESGFEALRREGEVLEIFVT